MKNFWKALWTTVLCVSSIAAQSPWNTTTFTPGFTATATNQTSAPLPLGTAPLNRNGSYSVGTITLTGTALTTVTFGVLGSSDNGATYYPLNLSAALTPGTVATTMTATANGIYNVNLAGVTNIEFVTSGTFTATSVKLLLTAAPNGTIGRSTGGTSTTAGVATDTIAASNSLVKNGATAICTGTSDQTCINTVINNRCAAGLGGNIVALNGTFNLSGSVVIPCANVTFGGQQAVMWGGFNHSAPCTIGSPCGALGTQGAILKATAAGFDLVVVNATTPCGNGADTTRCRGITIQNLYFQGYQYNNRAITFTNPQNTDISYVRYNMIQQTQSGIYCDCDTPYIEHNDIQDIGTGWGIETVYVNSTIANNIVWDSNGGCISGLGMVSNNYCGDLQQGIAVNGGGSAVRGNYLYNIVPPYINLQGLGVIATDNYLTVTTNITTASDWIRLGGNSNGAINNNTAYSPVGQGGYFIDNFSTGGTSIACGNALNGGWNGGGNAYNMGTSVTCPNVPGFSGGQTYNNATAYAAGIFVAYNGSIYISTQATTGNLPTNATYWTAITTAYPQAQYIASSITGVTSGNPITTWPDTSGWSNRALSVLSGGAKYISASNINAGPAVRFSATNSDALHVTDLQFGGTVGAEPRTVWVVVNIPNTNSNYGIVSGIGANTAILGTNIGTAKASMYSGACTISTCLSASALTNSTTYVIEYNINGASSRIAVNGTSNALSANASSTTWTTGMAVGAAECGASCFNDYYGGDLAEVDVLSGSMSNTDANVEGAALCAKYGVTCSTSW
jgi:hypothetical protein